MNPILKNVLAVLAGLVIGSGVNMGIILISGSIIPPPEGADMTTMEGLNAAMSIMEPRHFIMPFLAHALGTFVGALFAAIIAAKHKLKFALLIGILFMCGGIMMVVNLLNTPTWFIVLDLVVAYIPMGLIAGRMVGKK